MTRLHQTSHKAEGTDVFIALHVLHFSRSIIAKLTGFSRAYVGQVLRDCGYHERWDDVVDVRANIHHTLLERCAQLLAVNSFPSTA